MTIMTVVPCKSEMANGKLIAFCPPTRVMYGKIEVPGPDSDEMNIQKRNGDLFDCNDLEIQDEHLKCNTLLQVL